MRLLFVFLSIVLLVISGCAASKSNLTESRNAKTGRSNNSVKRDNTPKRSIGVSSSASTQPQGTDGYTFRMTSDGYELWVRSSGASTQPQRAAPRANDRRGGQNNRSKSVNPPSSKIPVPTVTYDRDKDVFTYREDGRDVFGLSSDDLVSLLLDFAPIIGNTKCFVETIIGQDLLTGDLRSPVDHFLGLACLSKLRPIKKVVGLTRAAVNASKAVKAASKIKKREGKTRRWGGRLLDGANLINETLFRGEDESSGVE